jgi:hypothetical protein
MNTQSISSYDQIGLLTDRFPSYHASACLYILTYTCDRGGTWNKERRKLGRASRRWQLRERGQLSQHGHSADRGVLRSAARWHHGHQRHLRHSHRVYEQRQSTVSFRAWHEHNHGSSYGTEKDVSRHCNTWQAGVRVSGGISKYIISLTPLNVCSWHGEANRGSASLTECRTCRKSFFFCLGRNT